MQPVAVADLLTATASRFGWRAGEAGREVRLGTLAEAKVRGDPLRLEQGLGNLIDNALRHGDGDVHLSAAVRGDALELHVRDSGPGLPAGFADRAFERFSRPDAARSGAGAGLGLAIVRMIAEAHGGSAHLADRPGGGVDAWIALPLGDGGPLTSAD